MSTPDRFRVITLSNRAPVKIYDREWPVIAEAIADSWASDDHGGKYQQAIDRGELDTYTLKVRQHDDGRAIVYGIYKASVFNDTDSSRAGELCPAGADLAAAVRLVGTHCHMPERVIRTCLANLPAEEL